MLELGAGLQRLYASLSPLELAVGAVEEEGNVRAYFVAERSFCGGKRGLGDEFVVLLCVALVLCSFYNILCFSDRVVFDMGGEKRTRTVLRMVMRRGKSETPLPRVSTEDSRKLREVRREVTQSLYVAIFWLDILFLFWRWLNVEGGVVVWARRGTAMSLGQGIARTC